MKFYFYISVLVILIYTKPESDCENTKPIQYSDCLLSDQDKKIFKYCCYKNDKYGKDCFAFDEYDYKIVMRMNKEEYYSNDTEFVCNSSTFLRKGITFFISILF